ncbi:MAG: SRPBCC domain-containing protein [Chloroflexi bacterium]|nr:SRPBCC domain-containing protein [Chloroflexota bacterium]
MYQRLTDPAELRRWWSQEAETDPRVGGEYALSWPALDRHLRGRYTVADPGRALGLHLGLGRRAGSAGTARLHRADPSGR